MTLPCVECIGKGRVGGTICPRCDGGCDEPDVLSLTYLRELVDRPQIDAAVVRATMSWLDLQPVTNDLNQIRYAIVQRALVSD